jgi:hypothetical protein
MPSGGGLHGVHAMSARGWHSPVLNELGGHSALHAANCVSAVAVQSAVMYAALGIAA